MKCHEQTWENRSTSDKPNIRTFEEFWPHYVRAHSKPRTRAFHAAGSVLAIVLFGLAVRFNLWLLIAVPVVGYGLAWYGHFFVEHNRPATFGHPFYSLRADYRMLFLMMAGRMEGEIAKHVSPSASDPASPAGSPEPSALPRSVSR